MIGIFKINFILFLELAFTFGGKWKFKIQVNTDKKIGKTVSKFDYVGSRVCRSMYGCFFYQLNSFIFTIYVGSYSGNFGSIIIVFFSSQRIRVSYFILCLGFSSYLNFWVSYFVVPLCCPLPPFLVNFTYSNLTITDSVKILPHSLGLFKCYFFLFTSLGTYLHHYNYWWVIWENSTKAPWGLGNVFYLYYHLYYRVFHRESAINS